MESCEFVFPINRRHQGLATVAVVGGLQQKRAEFPINRRHQGLATLPLALARRSRRSCRFQSIGVTKDWRPDVLEEERRIDALKSFQSIGVTKDWRRKSHAILRTMVGSFQSIGVTKDWRRRFVGWSDAPDASWFPINRRHQGLATSSIRTGDWGMALKGFQSIGVTKDWRRAARAISGKVTSNSFQSIGVTKDWRPKSRGLHHG